MTAFRTPWTQRWLPGEDRGADPAPGHFTVRLCRGGPEVPAQIHHDEIAGTWSATINGVASEWLVDPFAHQGVMRIWHSGPRIDPETFALLEATREWARRHQPAHPLLHPYDPVDVTALPPVVP